jgi:hypothetical protein
MRPNTKCSCPGVVRLVSIAILTVHASWPRRDSSFKIEQASSQGGTNRGYSPVRLQGTCKVCSFHAGRILWYYFYLQSRRPLRPTTTEGRPISNVDHLDCRISTADRILKEDIWTEWQTERNIGDSLYSVGDPDSLLWERRGARTGRMRKWNGIHVCWGRTGTV